MVKQENLPNHLTLKLINYFDKNKLDYYVFGRISEDLLAELIKIIIFLSKEDKLVIANDNLQTN